METTNLSKIKRERMISFLEELKKKNNDDSSIRALNEIENQLNSTKYGLVWENHEERVDKELEEKIPVFNELSDFKINSNSDNSYNFLLEGDNLHSLYLLEKTHKNRIDTIYIDPPYNTGNQDFKYNDCYVEKEDSYRHSKWLSFMYRRLEIAYKLLSNTGVIFISIDEHEIAQLMMLAQEIFGMENVDYLIWQKTDSKVDRNTNAKVINRFKNIHEAIIVCYKNKENTFFNKMMKLPDWKHKQSNPDNDPRGPWSSGIISFEEGHKNEDKTSENYYTIKTPSGKEYTRHWYVSKEEFFRLDADNRIAYPRNGEGVPRRKTFENEEKEYYMETILRGVGTSSSAKDELLDILCDRDIFDTPKPTKLIKELIRVSSKKDSIVLDFFAGSGTTGQAVIELNNEDGGKRKFILCTDNFIKENEKIKYLVEKNIIERQPRKGTKKYDEWYEKYLEVLKSENYKKIEKSDEFQKLGICKGVCYPRLKTVITGIRVSNTKYSEEKNVNLKYFKTDWVDRKPVEYFLQPELCKHVKEMIELENHIEIDNNEYVVVLNKEDLRKFIIDNNDSKIKRIWINESLILNNSEIQKLNNYKVKYIPRNYFSTELREVGE